MDPDQIAVIAAVGSVLAALGLRSRKDAVAGEKRTPGLVLGRAGAGVARMAGDVTEAAGRVAAGTAGAGIRFAGATVAHSAGVVVDGAAGVGVRLGRLGLSVLRARPAGPDLPPAASAVAGMEEPEGLDIEVATAGRVPELLPLLDPEAEAASPEPRPVVEPEPAPSKSRSKARQGH